ncbi:hypothetical protein BDB00DRAFT_831708 [Zychaea mexicana]|uniref:uncharacterized protein n=1 Tax=Zychaea mexicana TaxID=64656 RepID=UPI0022FE0480|nr:uncharacterized protein BDB00DRAFT_831708 [Zychaea mexicana]KAI9491684.1 hypothetical protein BDB00DRAFT_831708 [Zychaea mexicana]
MGCVGAVGLQIKAVDASYKWRIARGGPSVTGLFLLLLVSSRWLLGLSQPLCLCLLFLFLPYFSSFLFFLFLSPCVEREREKNL